MPELQLVADLEPAHDLLHCRVAVVGTVAAVQDADRAAAGGFEVVAEVQPSPSTMIRGSGSIDQSDLLDELSQRSAGSTSSK